MLCVSAPRAIPDADYGEGCSLAPKKRLSAAPEVVQSSRLLLRSGKRQCRRNQRG